MRPTSRHRNIHRWALGVLAMAGMGMGLIDAPAATGRTSAPATLSLREAVERLQTVSGYRFFIAVPQDLAETRKEIGLTGLSLFDAVAAVQKTYGCEVFSSDIGGFQVVAAVKGAEPQPLASRIGDYEFTVTPVLPTVERGVLQTTLLFTARDERTVEAIAGIDDSLKAVDNFGRPLIEARLGRRRNPATLRTRLGDYRQLLSINVADDRAIRIRRLSGNLVLYRKLTPVRLEFPLAWNTEKEAAGTERMVGAAHLRAGRATHVRQEVLVAFTTRWPLNVTLEGRGPSRSVVPHLVDEEGRVYRDQASRWSSVRMGESISYLRDLRFEGIRGRPTALVVDAWLKEEPDVLLPFEARNVPIPVETTVVRPERRPFYQKGGGGIAFRITDRAGVGAEGEVSLGISRRDGMRFGAVRWIEVLPDVDGRVALSDLRPGVYRVVRTFRIAPGSAAIPDSSPPETVTVTAGATTSLKPWKLGIAIPRD